MHKLIENNFRNQTVKEGDSATFDCQVTSPDKPHIQWLKKLETRDLEHVNSSEVITDGDDKYRLIHTSREIVQDRADLYHSQLILSRVTSHVAGTYICLVIDSNTRGTQSQSLNHKRAFLTVIPSKHETKVSKIKGKSFITR